MRNESAITKITLSFTKKKVLYFKDSATFQSRYCISNKVVY